MPSISRNNAIMSLRRTLIERLGITEELLVSVCAVMGLACLFGGIWLGDGQFYTAIDNGSATLIMRATSFFLYLVFFALVCRFVAKGPFDLQAFFLKSVGAALVCFIASYAGLTWTVHTLAQGSGSTALLWLFFMLSKTIGVPVTVGLICVFSQLRRKTTMRLSIIGILGSFVIYSISSQVLADAAQVSAAKLALSAALVLATCIFGMLGLNNEMFGRIDFTQDDMLDQHVIKRPAREVIDGGIVLTVVFSAVALGYLRSGFVGSDAHLQPASIVVLLIVVIISLLRQNLRIEHLFTTALFCTAASILLEPFLAVLCPVAITLLANTGTALFEVIVWCWAVWVTRNSQEVLTAASAMRLAVVAGHLLGTIAVALALLVVDTPADAASAAGMVIILLYMIEISVVVRTPSWTLPILTVEDDNVILVPASPDPVKDEAAQAIEEIAEHEARVHAGHAPSGSKHAAEETAASDNAAPEASEAQEATAAAAAQDADASAADTDGAEGSGSSGADNAAVADEANQIAAAQSFEELYWDMPLATVADTYRLTRREREVLALLARGHSFAAMEEALCISHNTMKMHARNIYTKMEVHSRQDVISMVDLVRENQKASRQ